MIDSTYHVEIDGTKYRLAEDVEATHHNVKGEPLRPPNSVTVQGENSQKFQMRPDTLLWTWTDWSAGEGKRKVSLGESGRSWQLNGVRAFEDPGHLIPGYYTETTQDTTGAADLVKSLILVVGAGELYGLDANASKIYKWDSGNMKWGAETTLSGPSTGSMDIAAGDDDFIYWVQFNSDNVWKRDSSFVVTLLNDNLIDISTTTAIAQLNDYVYVYLAAKAKVWEIPKTADAGVLIDTWTETGQYALGHSLIATLDAKVYVLVQHQTETIIREITPSSAAGVGFGAEVVRIKGFVADALWAHSGNLFMIGRFATDATARTVIYVAPDGTYGTLGVVRQGDDMGVGSGGAVRMLDHFWVQGRHSSGTLKNTLMQIDSITGGFGAISIDDEDSMGDQTGQSVVAFEGDIFWSSLRGDSTKQTMRAIQTSYMIESNAISPYHDFDFSGEKYLGSMELSVASLPADWTVFVDYEINNSGTFVNVIDYSVTGGTGIKTTVTTDSTTIAFRTLRLRVRFSYTGAGVPTSAPLLLGIDARASVSDTVLVFNYLLDLSDEHSAGASSRAGATKVDSFQATVAKTVAIDLKDGYTSKLAGVYDQYDVTIDAFDLLLSTPGEGVGYITLREIV